MQENKLKYDAILFDFDYTLADSSKGVIKCVNDSLRDLNLPLASPENICRTIGMPLTSVFEKLSRQADPSQIIKLTQLFKGHADEVMADFTVLYPLVNQTMQQLKNQDRKLGIVSTKYRYRIENILKRENALNWFDVIVGGEDVTSNKPHPEGLCLAITRINCVIDRTLFVGDSIVDAETASRAEVPFIAVLSGVTKRNEFTNYKAINIIDSLSELPKWLINY